MAGGINLSAGVEVQAPVPADNRSFNGTVPYTSVAQALSLIKPFQRYKELLVYIGADANSAVTYWFKDGVADANLVEKIVTVDVSGKADKLTHIAIEANITLDSSHNGNVLIVLQPNIVINIPPNLPADFNCVITSTNGNNYSFSADASLSVQYPSGLSFGENETCAISSFTHNGSNLILIRP